MRRDAKKKAAELSLEKFRGPSYEKPSVQCDEWSRCETDADRACFCTSRGLIRVYAVYLVPLSEKGPKVFCPLLVSYFMSRLRALDSKIDRQIFAAGLIEVRRIFE
jgi:hypothetical protein